MKQLPMTPELSAMIKAAVGQDVETADLAVFECIALNSKPLPGKNGTIFEKATVMPITLRQMADHVLAGNTLPLIADHTLYGSPKGRVFTAELNYNQQAGDLELRTLFYLDSSEDELITKLNSGVLDEVSVSFLSTEFLCSQCSWDYFGPESSSDNLYSRTCGNGHEIGSNGVHAELVGLSQFIEVSLVARGAADKPKIVGKSDSKLLPASSMRLAAKGFEIDGLICRAGLGDNIVTVDTNKLIADLMASNTSVATLTVEKSTLSTQLSAAEANVTAANARVAELETRLAAAEAAPTNEADYQVALAFLGELVTNLSVAAGEAAPAAADLPKTVADLKVAIEGKTSKLTALLPVGGVAAGAGAGDDDKPTLRASAFSNRKFKD